MTTMHDLRLQLREKTKAVSDLEDRINELKNELHHKDVLIREYEVKLKKKDEMISMKDFIIKEKDMLILKLETSLSGGIVTLSISDEDKKQITNNVHQNYNHNINTIPELSSSSSSSSVSISPSQTQQQRNLHQTSTLVVKHLQPPQRNDSPVLAKAKRLAISAEPTQVYKKSRDYTALKEYDKTEETKEFLRNGILDNDFMKNLEIKQINAIVNCMHRVDYEKDSLIIIEGDVGNLVYVLEEGTIEVIKDKKSICLMNSGKLFGELAILYNCTRTASIKALTNCKLWAIDRLTFQTIMVRFSMEKQREYMDLIKKIPTFQDLREDLLMKFIDIADECQYNNGEYIVRQYAKGNTFYIISKGKVKVTKSQSKWDEAVYVKHLHRGDYFGEVALQKEEVRSFNVIVDDPDGISCLLIERQAYNDIMNAVEGDLKREESLKQYKRAQTTGLNLEQEELNMVNIRLSEFEILTTLGVGGFGRVELVRNIRDSRTYALKIMKKEYIVAMKQQEHVMNERNIMLEAKSKHICRLYKTFKDRKYLYMVLEICLGGELWSLLRDRQYFEEHETKFYIACVTEALEYLHKKGIIYRDLKPENILIDNKGYCKLVDFGFAKKVGLGKKTWTFCGTPEYVAPEIILNKGHDIAADLWSLGILAFELLCGNPPFSGQEVMGTYNAILKGIDAVDFPRQIPKTAASLIKKLCRENPVERIGYQRGGVKDIQKHKWFEGFSWENFRSGTLEAPYVPQLKSNMDTSNFDKYAEDDGPEPADDVSGWEIGF